MTNTTENIDIPMYVFTCNQYLHLTQIFAHMFNKFWSPKKQVTILGYDEPDFSLPDNFKFVSMGEQPESAQQWSNGLRKFLKETEETHLMWATEDSFIGEELDLEIYNTLASHTLDSRVGKIEVTNNLEFTTLHDTIEQKLNYSIIESKQNTYNRLWGTWSIWNKEYLLKYLTNDLTPWEFESINSKKAINDSYRILGTKDNYAVKSCCAIRTTDGNSKAIIANEGKELVDADSFRAQKLSQPLDLRLINLHKSVD